MGAGCSSCKSKEAEADDAGDEAPLQVSSDGSPEGSGLKIALGEEASPIVQNGSCLKPDGQLTVMMFGMTGSGKSSLGNLIAGFDAFGYSDDTISVTNLDSVMRYEADDNSLILLDTIGLGDTELDQEKVVGSIRDVALSAPNGVDVLLFVMRNARITDDAIARLIYATEYLWGSQCLLNLYIVITHAGRYMNSKKEAKAWIDRQVELNWRFKHIFKIVGENHSRFVFIDNPCPKSGEPNLEERRASSREHVMKMLCRHPRDAIPAFTFSVMKRAKEIAAEQEAESSKDKSHKKSKGQDSSLKAAVKAEMASERKQALLKAKMDKKLQADASREVMAATKRFQARFESADADAGAGSPHSDCQKSLTPSAQPDGLRQACKRMASFIITRALSRKSTKSSHGRSPSEVDSEAVESEVHQEASETVYSEAWEEVLSHILAEVRKKMVCTADSAFKKLDKRKLGAITPLEFTQFLRAHYPNLRHKHVGGLWRRGDLNCDGQLDLMEFCLLFTKWQSPLGKPKPKAS